MSSALRLAFTASLPLRPFSPTAVTPCSTRPTVALPAACPRATISPPRQDPKSRRAAKSRNGKRVPTFRKLQQRHRTGPVAFRKEREQHNADQQREAGHIPNDVASSDGGIGVRPSSRSRRFTRAKADAIPLRDLIVGQRMDGVVRNTVRHGAYVDIGSTRDGLVHIRDMSVEFVHDVDDLLRTGDKVAVWIKYIDPVQNVLGLTMLRPALGFNGRVSVEEVKAGKRYEGVVQRVTNYGAYVDIGTERMGFLHVSALWGSNPGETLEYLRIWQKVNVEVEAVDLGKRYIRLMGRGVGGAPLSQDKAVGERFTIAKQGRRGNLHAQKRAVALAVQRFGDELVEDEEEDDGFVQADNETVDEASSSFDHSSDSLAEEATASDDEGDEYSDDEDVDSGEFDFAEEMGVTTTDDLKVAQMIDDETEFVGLDSAELKRLKEQLEEAEQSK